MSPVVSQMSPIHEYQVDRALQQQISLPKSPIKEPCFARTCNRGDARTCNGGDAKTCKGGDAKEELQRAEMQRVEMQRVEMQRDDAEGGHAKG